MAYVCGIVTKRELDLLRERGFEIEPCPRELLFPLKSLPGGPHEYIMVYVDANLSDVLERLGMNCMTDADLGSAGNHEE